MANMLRAGGPGIRIPAGTRAFLSDTSTLALGPRQTTFQCVVGLKTPECDVQQSPQSDVEIKNVLTYTSSSICLLGVGRDKSNFYLRFVCLMTLPPRQAIWR
jgi:hypothetical protein